MLTATVLAGAALVTADSSATAVPRLPAEAVLTAAPAVDSVAAWQEFRVAGSATGISVGSSVSLQQKQRGTWVSLPATTTVDRDGAYSLRVKLGLPGLNELRVISGETASAPFTVTVRQAPSPTTRLPQFSAAP